MKHESPLSDARLRRLLGGISLIAAPVALLIGTLIHPGLKQNAPAQLALIAQHPGAWRATHLLGLVFVIFSIPVVLALMRLLRGREAALGNVGGALALVGLVGWGAVVAIYGWVFGQAAELHDRGAMTELIHRLTHSSQVLGPTRFLSFGLVLGMACLAVALFRARVVPRWACPLIAAGFVQFAIGGSVAVLPVMAVGAALMSVGLGAVGLTVLRQTDGEWERSAVITGDQSVASAGT
jgi:hypothetical protein